ncbi:unnamed protein product [Heligmosomoides polygyrus]|uniref:Toxoplasma gondii family C protein n=1 Tax=Heligmosomoides polygyrus TaxID=6339 RepID=A0A183G8L1_HELPZ|nr:unnamed protein product [Heligmosomoides polygyrus]
MTEKSSTGAPSGQGDAPGDAPPANQEGADDKDEKKELDGTGAGSQMGGTTGGEGTTGATSTGVWDRYRKRGHPCYKVLCIVFSLLSLACLATAMTMMALMLNETGK